MAKRKFYYVGVMNNKVDDNTISFVYKIDRENRVAYWKTWDKIRQEKLKAYKFTSMIDAEQVAQALCLHGLIAMAIRPIIEIK